MTIYGHDRLTGHDDAHADDDAKDGLYCYKDDDDG